MPGTRNSGLQCFTPYEARFCRWLLQSADRAGSDKVGLTQEFLAEMLGVRRTSVTEIASKIQAQGLISYARGVITVLDCKGLEKRSCECFQTLLDQSAMLPLIARTGVVTAEAPNVAGSSQRRPSAAVQRQHNHPALIRINTFTVLSPSLALLLGASRDLKVDETASYDSNACSSTEAA